MVLGAVTSQVVRETLGRNENVQGCSGREGGYRQSWGRAPAWHPADGDTPVQRLRRHRQSSEGGGLSPAETVQADLSGRQALRLQVLGKVEKSPIVFDNQELLALSEPFVSSNLESILSFSLSFTLHIDSTSDIIPKM